jgi:hypothetical protein
VTVRGLPSALEGGPELSGLIPALLVFDHPRDVALAAERLHVPLAHFEAIRGDALQAELELPPGRWRLWPRHGAALWIGRRPKGFPAVPSERRELDLGRALVVLARVGLWPTELRVLDERGWTPTLGVAAAARALEPGQVPLALFGIWSDSEGRALRACLFHHGEVRAETEGLAERLLILLGAPNDD